MTKVRCLACGTTYEWHPSYPMCPNRYASPHDEEFLEAVAKNLAAAGALEKTTPAQHRTAIEAVRKARIRSRKA
jgi:hypothetical protein